MKIRRKAKKKKMQVRKFGDRILHFTETVLYWLFRYYIIWQFISVGLIIAAICKTNQFSYLDTFISETNKTFRDIVGIVIVKFCVENVFKYNTFSFTSSGVKMTKKKQVEEDNGEDQLGSEIDEP